MSIHRLAIRTNPNHYIHDFFVNKRICNGKYVFTTLRDLNHGGPFAWANESVADEATELLFSELLLIEGVDRVSGNIYEITVAIGGAFIWSEVNLKLLTR